MNNNTFMIIDDDINVVKMLTKIINKNDLGRVVGELENGEHAVDEVLFYNPDILLIDYLMPFFDGVEIVKGILEKGFSGKIIMISQVIEENMISSAYNTGIFFFIKKPINSIEVINVIKTASHNLELERSMSVIQNALGSIPNMNMEPVKLNINQSIENILSDIGIVGDLGCDDLRMLIEKILKHKKRFPNSPYKLQEIYIEMAKEKTLTEYSAISPNAIEQRIRRTVQKSLSNIAEMGLDDYYNSKFTEYSTLLFDFKQVKQEMNHIEDPISSKGKINIKKFIEGVLSKLEI